MESDLTLLTRYHRDGDAGAFQALMRAHAGMVFAAARRITQDAALAEEVAQDTFLALARRGQSVRESVGAWLHHVARQKACNALRGELRRQRHEQTAAEVLLEQRDGSWAEMEPVVDAVIDALADGPRALLIEHFLEQRTQQEMAQRLGMSQSTISRQIEAALEILREGLKQQGVMCGLGLAGLLSAHTAQAAAPASLTASLGKIAMTGIRSGTASAAAGPTFFIAMTTTTKVVLAGTAVIGAAISMPFLMPQKPVSALVVVRPMQAASPVSPQSLPTTKPQAESRPRQGEMPTLDQLWEEGLAVPDDRALILAEFKRLRATIREEYVDADIASIVRDHFGNNRAAFERHLQEQKGLSLEEFRTQRREMMIISVLKAKTTQGITDEAAKKRAIDDWLAELRRKAGSARSTSAAQADDAD